MPPIVKLKRRLPPRHFSLRFESFSKLAKACSDPNGRNYYESVVFSAEGYSCKLTMYPNGNTRGTGNGRNHISIFLGVDDFPTNEDIYADVKFFVFDQKHNFFWAMHDAEATRFHEKALKWGFDQFISLNNFRNPNNGFLLNDTCEFGVEISVVRPYTEMRQTLSTIKPPRLPFRNTFNDFSTLGNDMQCGDPMTFGGKTWKLQIYPKGFGKSEGNWLSLFLELIDAATLPPGEQVWAEYKLRVVDQRHDKHKEILTHHWFSSLNTEAWGTEKILPRGDLFQASKGYVMNDTLIVEVEFLNLSVPNIS